MSRWPKKVSKDFKSVLYRDRAGLSDVTIRQPGFFVDLNLDQVVKALTEGREEYALTPFYWQPLRQAEEVRYRQEIFRDLENAGMSDRVYAFAAAMRGMKARLPDAEKVGYKYQRERFFLEAASLYCVAVTDLAEALSIGPVNAAGLLLFRDFLVAYVGSNAFVMLQQEIRTLLDDLDGVAYGIYTRELTIEVRPRGTEIDYTEEIERLFGRFRQERDTGERDLKLELDTSDYMNPVEGRILDGLATLFPAVFARLDAFCDRHAAFVDERVARFDREIQFYLAYLEYIAPLRAAGLPFCYAGVSETDKTDSSTEGFDLALAHKLTLEGKPIVQNDWSLGGSERVIVVSGPNQGGKTTFSRAFGQLHYLAALGVPVPGREARLFLFDQLFTHFERAEHAGDLRSKLEDDLVRLHEIVSGATTNSLVILNEILSSATLEDALLLSRKIMERIDRLDLLCVWVSFLDEIRKDSNKTVSMVSEMDAMDKTVRTFRVVRREADGLAYALAIAGKYGVTYEDLKRRLGI